MRAAANLVRVFDLAVRSPGSAISRLVYFHKHCDSLHPPPDLLTTALAPLCSLFNIRFNPIP